MFQGTVLQLQALKPFLFFVVSVDYLLFMVHDVKLNPNPEEVADV